MCVRSADAALLRYSPTTLLLAAVTPLLSLLSHLTSGAGSSDALLSLRKDFADPHVYGAAPFGHLFEQQVAGQIGRS